MTEPAAPRAWPKDLAVAAFLVCLAFAGVRLAMRSYFADDDFINLAIAREMGLTWAYLVRSVFGHFVPGYRLTTYGLWRFFPFNYTASEALLMGCWLGAVAATYRLLRFLFGPRWPVVLLTILFGASLVQLPNVLWLASGLHFLPTTFLGVLCLDGYLRFRLTGRRRHAVVSVVVFAIGATFFDAMIVFPGLAVLFAVLILPKDRSLRSAVRSVLESWPIWLAYAVPEGVLLGYRLSHPAAYAGPPLAGPRAVIRFIGVAWSQSFGPALIGLDRGRFIAGSIGTTIAVSQAVLAVVVVVSIVRSPRAWRPWTIFGMSFLAMTIAIGAARLSDFGSGLGRDYRYQAYAPFVFVLTLAFACLPTERLAVPIVAARGSHATSASATANQRVLRRMLAVMAVLVMAGYLANDWTSAKEYAQQTDGYPTKRFIDRYWTSVAAIRRTTSDVEIYNTELPIVASPFYPFNQASRTIGNLDRRVHFHPVSSGYLFTQDGTLHPARFVTEEPLSVNVPGGCVGSARRTAAVLLSASRPLGQAPWFVRFSYRSLTGVRLVIDGAVVNAPPGSGALVENVSPAPFRQLAVYVAAGDAVCISSAEVGQPQTTS